MRRVNRRWWQRFAPRVTACMTFVTFRDDVLTHPIARAGHNKDMAALASADATVLVLPCGRSAHLELGWACGMQRKTLVLLDDPISEPELMYLACTKVCISLAEVIQELAG